jgi:hypothetical protein
MKNLNLIGLVLNVTASVLFLIDSSRLSGLLASLVHKIAPGIGRFDSSRNRPTEQEIKSLEQRITQSKWIQIIGAVLLALGFILQLIHELKMVG